MRLPRFLRKGLPAATLFGAGLALAGCSPFGLGGGSGGQAPALPQPPMVGQQPVTGEVIGNGEVRVAMLLPLSATGNAGAVGSNLRNAAALALNEFSGANIQILIKDDKGTPEGARVAATEAISQGAELIIGPLFSQSVTAAASIARPANVPMVAFSTDTSTASRGVFLLSFLPETDVSRIISYAASQGKRSYGVLLPANGYGTVVEAALQRAVAANGARIVVIERYALDKVAMQAAAEKVAAVAAAGQVDSIFMPDAGDAAPFLANVLSAKGVRSDKVKFLGSGQWDDSRIAQESNLSGAWFPAPDRAGFTAFAGRYKAAYGADPLRAASLGYDATSLAAGLVARFGAQRFALDTLTNANGFIGIDGAFRLMPDGTNQRGLAIYEIRGGQPVVVDPAPTSFSRPGT